MTKWEKKVAEGMRLIAEGCSENKEWNKCAECPFDDFCTAINDAYWERDWHDMAETFSAFLKKDLDN